jgi:hypothetical protein
MLPSLAEPLCVLRDAAARLLRMRNLGFCNPQDPHPEEPRSGVSKDPQQFCKPRSTALVLALAALLLTPTLANACSCTRQSPEAYRASADVIIEGRVIAVSRSAAGPGRVTAEIEVTRRVKGAPSATVSVVTRGQSAACGVPFAVGQTGEFLLAGAEGRYSTNSCLMIGVRR